MMDVTALVPVIVSALVPYFARGAEKIVDKTAEEVFTQRGKIFAAVKSLFLEDELTTLNLFAENPESAEAQAELRGELKHLLKANPETAKSLEEMLARLNEMSSSEITNEEIDDSTIDNEMKRGAGKAAIINKGIRGSKISNKMN